MLSLRVGFLIYTVLSTIHIRVSSQSLLKVINYQYQGQSLYCTPEKNIVGWHIDYDSNNGNWDIQHVGGNLISIQNVATGLYLGVDGERVTTRPDPTSWQQFPVPGGWYQIATQDGSQVLMLTGSSDSSPVILKRAFYKGQDAQWGYEPTVRVG